MSGNGSVLAIGLMSGTSADGIDAALVRVRLRRGAPLDVLAARSVPHPPALRSEILAACVRGDYGADRLCALHQALGHAFGQAAVDLCADAGVDLADVNVIGSHGQTVWHQPEPVAFGGQTCRGTLQLGNPALIAAATGCTVVSDFRSADMALGGQGAPLVPMVDWLTMSADHVDRAVQNIGGIGNVTWLRRGGTVGDIVAFDTGPGNMLIDAAAQHVSAGDQAFDMDGRLAAAGRPSEAMVRRLIEAMPFYATPPPKSTGREAFGAAYLRRAVLPLSASLGILGPDLVATLTELTARSIADAYRRWLPGFGAGAQVVACGGGARNPSLMACLRRNLDTSVVTTSDALGIDASTKEAAAFAVLGALTLWGLPGNVPTATGASGPAILGSVTPGARRPIW
ncbi:MAG: anhydro-N-acetylmuramic acid kinase [Armatimonadetes bacterium]|nr:anhydro-N-acetylmuramic acid kinase [Armatimonadota bacterium]